MSIRIPILQTYPWYELSKVFLSGEPVRISVSVSRSGPWVHHYNKLVTQKLPMCWTSWWLNQPIWKIVLKKGSWNPKNLGIKNLENQTSNPKDRGPKLGPKSTAADVNQQEFLLVLTQDSPRGLIHPNLWSCSPLSLNPRCNDQGYHDVEDRICWDLNCNASTYDTKRALKKRYFYYVP